MMQNVLMSDKPQNFVFPETRIAKCSSDVSGAAWSVAVDPAHQSEHSFPCPPTNWPLQRQHQYISARYAATRAMRELDIDRNPPGRSADGSPAWPAGIVGSLAHTDSFAFAAVTLSQDLAIGVDVEPNIKLPEDALNYVLNEFERSQCTRFADGYLAVSTLIFCWKECLHKAIFPQTGITLEFDEVEIRLGKNFGPVKFSGLRGKSDRAKKALGGLKVTADYQLLNDDIYAWLVLNRGC